MEAPVVVAVSVVDDKAGSLVVGEYSLGEVSFI